MYYLLKLYLLSAMQLDVLRSDDHGPSARHEHEKSVVGRDHWHGHHVLLFVLDVSKTPARPLLALQFQVVVMWIRSNR